MKTLFLTLIALALTVPVFGQGTQQRTIITTSQFSRGLNTNETAAGWLAELGVPSNLTNYNALTNFLGVVVIYPTVNVVSLSADTNNYFPTPINIAPGQYLLYCSVLAAATNTTAGFGTTNGNLTIGTTTGTNLFNGTLTVTDTNAVYGFFLTQTSYDSNSVPILSSNSVAWLYRVK